MRLPKAFNGIAQDVWRGVRRRLGLHLLIGAVVATGLVVLCVIASLLTSLYGRAPEVIDTEHLHAIAHGPIGVSQANELRGSDILELRQRSPLIAQGAAYQWSEVNLGAAGSTRMADALSVDGDLFGTLRWPIVLGRNFQAGDFDSGAPPTAIISDLLWRSHFAADKGAIGQIVRLDGEAVQLVGVLAPELTFPFKQQVYRSTNLDTAGERLNGAWSLVLNVRDDSERQALEAVIATFQTERVQLLGEDAERAPLRLARYWQATTGPQVQMMSLVLATLVALILLLAASNAGGLLLVHWVSRGRELATRVAIGQGMARSIIVALSQSLLIAITGLLLAIPISSLLLRRLERWMHESENGTALYMHMNLSSEVLAWAALGTLLAAVILALPTVRRIRSNQLVADLKQTGRGVSAGVNRFSQGFFGLQCALATLTLLVAVVCAEGARRELDRPLGFATGHLLTANFRIADTERLSNYAQTLRERVSQLTGVEVASIAGATPIALTPERELIVGEQSLSADFFPVDERYAQAWGLPLISGSWFSENDVAMRNPVVVIDRTLAESAFAGDAIGRSLRVKDRRIGEQELTVIGVTDAVRLTNLGGIDKPSLFSPLRSDAGYTLTLTVRTSQQAQSLLRSVQQLALEVDPDIALVDLRDFEGMRWVAADWTRLVLGLFAPIALIAALLAATSLAGLLGFLVTQRSWEIGLRRALGARGGLIVGTVLGGLRAPAIVGVVIGLGGALILAIPLGNAMYGEADQGAAAAAAALLILGLALAIAALLPLRRALGVQPAKALRGE